MAVTRERGPGAAATSPALDSRRAAWPELAADRLGRRLPLWPAHPIGRGYLRAVQDQYQLGFRDAGRGAGGDRQAGFAPPSATGLSARENSA